MLRTPSGVSGYSGVRGIVGHDMLPPASFPIPSPSARREKICDSGSLEAKLIVKPSKLLLVADVRSYSGLNSGILEQRELANTICDKAETRVAEIVFQVVDYHATNG